MSCDLWMSCDLCMSCDLQEPELSLKRIAASALSDISKHSPELAQTVVDAGAIAHLAQMILNPDAKLKVGELNIGHLVASIVWVISFLAI